MIDQDRKKRSVPVFKRKQKDANIYFCKDNTGLIRIGRKWYHVSNLDSINCTTMVRYTWPLMKNMEKSLAKKTIPACNLMPERKVNKLKTVERFYIQYKLTIPNQRNKVSTYFYAPIVPAATMKSAMVIEGYANAYQIAKDLFNHYCIDCDQNGNKKNVYKLTYICIIKIIGE